MNIKASQGRVLCVDDEPNITRSLRWLLQKDFTVEVAGSGAEGLEKIRQGDFDVVVSDQRMPGMMGSEFLREVRKVSPRTMRILLTGYSDLQAILRSVNEGEVFRFINKPWITAELIKVVGEAAHIARTQPGKVAPVEPEEDLTFGDSMLVVDDDPNVSALITEAIGNGAQVSYARDVAEAVAAFDREDIGIIVSNMRVASVDATRMLKLIKQQHPDIVAVVYTDSSDAVDVIGLINQAQIFRFLPKPMKPTMLRLALAAAASKRRQLKSDPGQQQRHAVEALSDEQRRSLVRDVEQVARASAPRGGQAGSLLQRLGGGLLRMLGRAREPA